MFLRTLMVSISASALAAGAAWAQTTTGVTIVGPPASGANITPEQIQPSGPNGTPYYNYNYGGRWQNGKYYQGQYYKPYYNGPTWGIDPYYYGR